MKRFIAALSKGRAEGHATLVMVETFGEYQINKRYTLRQIERFKIKSYYDVVNRIIEFLDNDYLGENVDQIADITACGQKLIKWRRSYLTNGANPYQSYKVHQFRFLNFHSKCVESLMFLTNLKQ